uniref:hypothetical protein n=1 Tax=Methylobacterium oryzae TaxID=334852 RepID=UPI00155DC778|nr:hypothetical protein [Methylobacterium oryzae]
MGCLVDIAAAAAPTAYNCGKTPTTIAALASVNPGLMNLLTEKTSNSKDTADKPAKNTQNKLAIRNKNPTVFALQRQATSIRKTRAAL